MSGVPAFIETMARLAGAEGLTEPQVRDFDRMMTNSFAATMAFTDNVQGRDVDAAAHHLDLVQLSIAALREWAHALPLRVFSMHIDLLQACEKELLTIVSRAAEPVIDATTFTALVQAGTSDRSIAEFFETTTAYIKEKRESMKLAQRPVTPPFDAAHFTALVNGGTSDADVAQMLGHTLEFVKQKREELGLRQERRTIGMDELCDASGVNAGCMRVRSRRDAPSVTGADASLSPPTQLLYGRDFDPSQPHASIRVARVLVQLNMRASFADTQEALRLLHARLACEAASGRAQALAAALALLQPPPQPEEVRFPGDLWHIGAHHKLAKYGFIITGVIDDKTRLITSLQLSDNNRDQTVLCAFGKGVAEYGLPTKVSADREEENLGVRQLMFDLRGEGEHSFVAGTPTHARRIARLWVDMQAWCTKSYEGFFQDMEANGDLDVRDASHIFALQLAFFPHLQRSLRRFQHQWNWHPMSTCRNKTPVRMWVEERLTQQNRSLFPAAPIGTATHPSLHIDEAMPLYAAGTDAECEGDAFNVEWKRYMRALLAPVEDDSKQRALEDYDLLLRAMADE